MYYFCAEKGAYTEIGSIPSGPKGEGPHGPRYIEFHPTLDICYVVNELGSNATVFGFDRDAAAAAVAAAAGEEGGVVSRGLGRGWGRGGAVGGYPLMITSNPSNLAHFQTAAAAAAASDSLSESKRGKGAGAEEISSFACTPERAAAAREVLKKR